MENSIEIPAEYLGGYREKEINDHDYYMGLAALTSLKSIDPSTRVGACYVKDGKVISFGYNQPPYGWNIEDFPFDKDLEQEEFTKYPFIIHAEVDGLNGVNVKDGTCYVTLFPCRECAKAMAHAGVKEVVYLHRFDDCKDSLISLYTLRKCNIKVTNYENVKSQGFDSILLELTKNEKERVKVFKKGKK